MGTASILIGGCDRLASLSRSLTNRRRRDRRGHRRLRRRHSRRAARQDGRGRREAEGARRHVSHLGMHSHQGAARARPRAEGHSARHRVGRDDCRTARRPSTWRRCTRARTRSSAGSPRASSSCSRRTRSTGSRAPRGSPARARSTSSKATSRRSRRRRSSSRPARRRAACRRSRSITQRIITSDEAIHLKEVPKSLVILGSGAVGVEFASIFRRFGSEVTIIELLPRLVPVEDEAVSAELEKSFKKQGITVLTGTKVTKAAASSSGVSIEARNARRQDAEDCGRYAARGDRPRTGHDRPGRRGGRHRDGTRLHQGRRSVPHVRAGRSRRSATSSRSAPACIRSSRTCRRWKASSRPSASPGKDVQPLNYDHVPGCTYCDPEIGSVGLTEARGEGARLRRADRDRFRSACSAEPRWPANPRGS